jgi:glycerophosphoryl diester phosphodiesterase
MLTNSCMLKDEAIYYDRIDEKNVLKNGIDLGNWNKSKPLTQAGKIYLNICCNWIPAYAGTTDGSDALVNFREVALGRWWRTLCTAHKKRYTNINCGGMVGYFIALLSTLFLMGSLFLFVVSQVSEYAFNQRSLASWVYHVPIAHRGFFNHPTVPENSLTAFKMAIAKGYAIELDVRLSADGEVIVFHDEELERATGIKGIVNQASLKNLRLWDSQERIPSLKETLALVDGQVPLYIELKTNEPAGSLEQAVHELVKDYPGRFAILSFNPQSLEWFRLHAPEIYRAQNLSLKESNLPWYSFCWHAWKSCKLSKPHLIVYDALELPPRLVKALSWLKPFIAYNVNSLEMANGIKSAASNIIFEQFDYR